MTDIGKRIRIAQRALERLRPCTMVVTLADGREIVTDGGGAIDLVWDGAPVVKVQATRGGNGMLDGLLTALVEDVNHDHPGVRKED